MKTIPALLDAVPTDRLAITEASDDVRLRAPVLELRSGDRVLCMASAFGGPKARQRADQVLGLVKLSVERAAKRVAHMKEHTITELPPEAVLIYDKETYVPPDRVETTHIEDGPDLAQLDRDRDELHRLRQALDAILSADVTSAKRAKEIAEAALQPVDVEKALEEGRERAEEVKFE